MVNGHIVARGAGVARNRHPARPAGINRRSLGSRQVHALMIRRGACRGRGPVPEGAGELDIAAGHKPAGAGRAAAAGIVSGIASGIGPGAAVGAAALRRRRGLRGNGGIGRHVRQPFRQLGFIVLLLLGGYVVQQLVFHLGILQLQRLQLVRLRQQLQQQGVRFRLLFIQLSLGHIQLVLGQLKLLFFHLQLGLGFLHLLGGSVQFLQPPLIRGGNLLHHVQPVQQVREIVGLEEHLPVAEAALLLHGADSDFVLLAELVEPALGSVQLILFVRDEDVEGGNLLVDVDDLGAEQADLLVNHILSCHNIGNFILIFLVIVLNLLDLLLNFLLLLLQLVDLLADFAGGSRAGPGREQADDQGQQHHCSHDSSQDGYETFAIVHKLLLFAWEGVTGRCTPRGLHKFLHKRCRSADGGRWRFRCCPHSRSAVPGPRSVPRRPHSGSCAYRWRKNRPDG